MIIVNELSPVVQRVVHDAVAANPACSPYDFVQELTDAVSNPDGIEAILSEWDRVAEIIDGGDSDEDEFDGDGFVHGDPLTEEIFEEMRLLLLKLDGTYESI